MQIDILEAQHRLSELINSALAGEEVFIASKGEPVVRLVPAVARSQSTTAGRGRAIVDWVKTHPLPPSARRSASEIEHAIEEERASWE